MVSADRPTVRASGHNGPVPELIIEVLPFALGVFASPLPVIVSIVMLFTPHPRQTAVVYVVTWTLGLTAVTVLFSLFAGAIDVQDGARGWATWLRIVLGVALLALAIRMWLGRSSRPAPEWLAGVMEAGPREAVRFGVLMSAANPKELLMALAAGLAIGAGGAGVVGAGVALVVFVLVGAASVAGPLLVFLVGGEGTLRALVTAREWLQRNNTAVAAAVFGVIGLWLLVGGIAKL